MDRTVLLIDSFPDDRIIYTAGLENCGLSVINADGPDEGVEIALRVRPALIITELYTRTERGWKVLELLRSHPETAAIPIIAVSAYALPDDRERAVASGATSFLPKPITPHDLSEFVTSILGIR